MRKLRRRCGSQVHPLIRRSSFNSSIVCKSSDRVPQRRRRMSCNEVILVIDSPRSIEQLADFDLCLRIRASLGTRREIQDKPSDSNAVIIAHHRAIAEADDSIQIQLSGNLSPRLLGLSGRDGKPTIKPRDKPFEEAIRPFEGLNPLQTEFGGQTVLQDPKESLNAPLGLGGEGWDGPDA